MMIVDDFRYRDKFPSLDADTITGAIDIIETGWYGVLSLWATLPADIRNRKRLLCENLLVAWYLADTYPTEVEGIVSNGGIPLTSKTIGDTSVTFADMPMQDAMKVLSSNTFGLQAAQMIMTAPERMGIYG